MHPHRGFWWAVKWLILGCLINIALVLVPWMIGSFLMHGHF